MNLIPEDGSFIVQGVTMATYEGKWLTIGLRNGDNLYRFVFTNPQQLLSVLGNMTIACQELLTNNEEVAARVAEAGQSSAQDSLNAIRLILDAAAPPSETTHERVGFEQ